MKDVNRIELIGNLGKDPESFQFDNGGQNVTLSVATNEYYKSKTGEGFESKTEWHRVVVKGRYDTERSLTLKKGQRVRVVGKLAYRQWEKDGKINYITEIVVAGSGHMVDLQEKADLSELPSSDMSIGKDPLDDFGLPDKPPF